MEISNKITDKIYDYLSGSTLKRAWFNDLNIILREKIRSDIENIVETELSEFEVDKKVNITRVKINFDDC